MRRFTSGPRSLFEGEKVALKITAFYLLLGLAWVLVFCELVPVPEKVRDTIYVVSMAWLLYWLIDHGVRAVRRSEEALKESEKRLAGILETNPCGILLLDRQGVIAYANLAASTLFGVKRSELVGRLYKEVGWEVTTADGKYFADPDHRGQRVLQDGLSVYDLECDVRIPGGSRVTISLNSAPLYDTAGKISGMVVAFVDITERKKAQELVLRKLSLAVEQSPTAIMITDTKSRIEYVNPSYTRMTGYPLGEVVGSKITTACDQSEILCQRVCEDVCRKGEWKQEQRSTRKNGEEYWETVSVTPIRDGEGEITHYLWIREDITGKRKSDEALRKVIRALRTLGYCNDALVRVTEEAELLREVCRIIVGIGGYRLAWVGFAERDERKTVRPAAQAGYEKGYLEGVNITWSDAERGRGPTGTAIRTGAPVVVQRILEDPCFAPWRAEAIKRGYLSNIALPLLHDGQVFGALTIYATEPNAFDAEEVDLLTDLSGNLAYGIMALRERRNREKAEEELRESEERFREMFEQTEEPILLFASGSHRILDANPAAVAVYGFSHDELVGNGTFLIADPSDKGGFEARIRAIRENGTLSLDRVYQRRKGGARIIVSLRAKSIRLKGGPVTYCSVRDITEKIRLEEEAKAQQAKLIHANRMTALGTIVSGVAHEVSNPNNLIMFNSPLLLAAWKDALPILLRNYRENGEFTLGGIPFTEMRSVVPKLLSDISDSSQRIKGIVGMLKDFARRDKRRLDSLVDLNEVTRMAIAILRHEIAKGTRNFRVEYGAGLPEVKGWSLELEQVLVNLLVNSLQALPDPSCGVFVSTSWNRETGCVEIRVRDEGAGMSEETMARLTEPFFSTKLDSGGLGLGLSISHTIVKEHKGTLTFESEIGKGTVARIALPAAMEEEKGHQNGIRARVLHG